MPFIISEEVSQEEREATAFLLRHFGPLPVGSDINIRPIVKGRGVVGERWFHNPAEAARYALQMAPGADVYYGVNPRETGRGDKTGVTYITCLHADVDFKAFSSPHDALEALLDFEMEVTDVVHSGNGLHAYWQLNPVVEATADNVAYLEALMQRLYYRLGGGSLDGVQDVSRILRVPGTLNHKDSPAKLVRVIHSSEKSYAATDFEAVLPLLPKKVSRLISHHHPQYEAPDVQQLQEMLGHVDPNLPYAEWVSVLMAIHSVLPGNDGLIMAEEWCAAMRESAGQQCDVERRWKGFRRQGYSLGTLIHYALEGGWQPVVPKPVKSGRGPGLEREVQEALTQREANRLKVWQGILHNTPEVTAAELPPVLRAAVEHVAPLGIAFQGDWNQMLTITFWSSLFPHIKFENLNLTLWFLGLGPQGVGKNRTSDEVHALTRTVQEARGEEVIPFTSGSTVGMLRRLEGENQRMLAYYAEFVGFLKSLKSDSSSNLSELMCNVYDGRGIAHQLSQEEIVGKNPYLTVVATTTPRALRDYGSRDDLNNGYLSRFWFCAPNALDLLADMSRNEEERAGAAEILLDHLRGLPELEKARFDTPGGLAPPALIEYMARLGLGSGRVLDLEEEMDADNIPSGRLIARVKKVSALLELGEILPRHEGKTLLVSERNVALAIRLVERANAYAQRAARWISASKDEGAGDKILLKLKANKDGLTARELQQMTHYQKRELEAALELLIDDGSIGAFSGGISGKKVIYKLTGVRA